MSFEIQHSQDPIRPMDTSQSKEGQETSSSQPGKLMLPGLALASYVSN